MRGMMTTNQEEVVEMPVAHQTVIDPPELDPGVDMGSLVKAEHAAKTGIVRSLNALRTYMTKLQAVQQDAGVWCAPRGVPNPVSAIGGSNLTPRVEVELEKIFARYVAAIRKGVPTTLEGLNLPL